MVENSEEINRKIDQVIENQKIDGFGAEEFKILVRLRQAFEYGINSIDQILFNDDVKSALFDIVRDWNADKYKRNTVIVKDMEILEGVLKYLKSKEKENS